MLKSPTLRGLMDAVSDAFFWSHDRRIESGSAICFQQSTRFKLLSSVLRRYQRSTACPQRGWPKCTRKVKKGEWASRLYFNSGPIWSLALCACNLTFQVSLVSGSWWTWTTTSSSITPTKTPSSSTSRATRTPTRSRWRRSDGSPADLKALQVETRTVTAGWLKIYEAAIDWFISWLTVLETVHWWTRRGQRRYTPDPSLTPLHYEASLDVLWRKRTQNKKWTS